MEIEGLLVRFTGLLALSTAVFATPANAQVVEASWASTPDEEQMADAHPSFAALAGIDGDAVLSCVVGVDGRLSLCEAKDVRPAGLGFDRAALMLTPYYRVNPRRIDGQAVKSTVRFRVGFLSTPWAEPDPWTGAAPSPEHLAMARSIVERQPNTFLVMPDDLDVDPDREDKVRAMVAQTNQAFDEPFTQASALALARLTTPEELQRILAGQGDMPPVSDEVHFRANDAWQRLAIDTIDRLRSLYCAQYDCPAPPSSGLNATDPRGADASAE